MSGEQSYTIRLTFSNIHIKCFKNIYVLDSICLSEIKNKKKSQKQSHNPYKK